MFSAILLLKYTPTCLINDNIDTNSSYKTEILIIQPSTLNKTFSIKNLIKRVEEF